MSIAKELYLLGNTTNEGSFNFDRPLIHKIKNDFFTKITGSIDIYIESNGRQNYRYISDVFIGNKVDRVYDWFRAYKDSPFLQKEFRPPLHSHEEIYFYSIEADDIISYFHKSEKIGNHFKVLLDDLIAKDELEGWVTFEFTGSLMFSLTCKDNLKMFNGECLAVKITLDDFFFPNAKTD